jgi:hypothetical protein
MMNRVMTSLLMSTLISTTPVLDQITTDAASAGAVAPIDAATEEPAVTRQLLGGGTWESGRDGAGKRSWQVELKRRSDDSITGRITVIGSAVVQEARIEIIGSLRDRVIGPLAIGGRTSLMARWLNGSMTQFQISGSMARSLDDSI